MDVTRTAFGAWNGGRFMSFGEPLPEERWIDLVRHAFARGIRTFITADVYGCGAADELLARSLAGLPRADYCLVGAIGHDFYKGQRQGSRGFPRFTDPSLRGPADYADYLQNKLSLLQLACVWNLSQAPVKSVVPTLIQESGKADKTIESKADELALLPHVNLSAEEVETIGRIGDNRGCMPLKGANRHHTTAAEPDRWGLSPDLEAVGKKWGVDPDRDLVPTHPA